MSAGEWLAERKQPPAGLAAALASSLRALPPHEGGIASELVAAARRLAPRVIEGGGARRSGALDLLTLDALITYSMDAGSTTAATCESTADELLSVIGQAESPR